MVAADPRPGQAADPTAHYDDVVDAWAFLLQDDLHYGYFSDPQESLASATDGLTDQMIKLASPAPGQHVLDVGCGTGRAACRLALEAGCQVTGISPSGVCVQRSNERARSENLQHLVRFVPADGMNLPCTDASFDIVWLMESSHLVPDKPLLLAECARVLRPGGSLVLCDIMLSRKLPLEDVIEHRDEFLLLRDVFGRARMEPVEFYIDELHLRGLELHQHHNIATQTRPTFAHWRANAAAHREQLVDDLGELAWGQFVDACGVLERFWDEDVLRYGILSVHKPVKTESTGTR